MDMYDISPRGSPTMDSPPRHTRGASPPRHNRGPPRHRDDYRPSDSYRERRRSPDRRRERDRRRSRSPANIDRYQPDRNRDDYRPPRSYSPSRRRRSSPDTRHGTIDRYVPGQAYPSVTVNPLPDPLTLDTQVGYAWFASWWHQEQLIKEEKECAKAGRPPRIRGERESREAREEARPKVQAAYDQYKENLQKVQAETFVRHHKDEDWFRERYDPEQSKKFRQNLRIYRSNLYQQWQEDLASGLFDQFTLEGIYKTESNGQGGILEKEEGETVAAAEILQTGDLLPTKGGDLRDYMALQPTLLLKTIAPTVTREKLEAFAIEHLGEDYDGFRHLSLSDPNPTKKCHRMGWIILKQNPNDPEDTELPDATAEEGEASGTALTTAERALIKIDGKTIEDAERGNFTVHCGVHRPPDAPRKKALWDLFSAPERVRRDLELARRLVRRLDNELGDECFGVAKIEERVEHLHKLGALQSLNIAKSPENLDMVEEDIEEGMVDEDEIDDEDLLVSKKKLDLLVEYLRRVYNFCFFCVFESDSVHELQRKCPGGHLRRPRASLTSAAKDIARASAAGEPFPLKQGSKDAGKTDLADEGDGDIRDPETPADDRNKFAKPSGRNVVQLQRAFNWVKTFEDKIMQILEPDNVDLNKVGGVPLAEGLEVELKKYVQQEDTNKYRCRAPECTKLFKGFAFWRRHVETRHEDFFEKVRGNIELINAYVLDPSHIAPSRSDATSNGHFPLGNTGAPTGTPRGFSLQSHMPMNFNPSVGAGFNGVPWGPPGSTTNPIHSYVPGVGPVRSGGRGYGGSYRSNGPYARLEGRGGRIPSFSGRGDGSAATHGRTVRSYEDLDAAATTSTAALMDY